MSTTIKDYSNQTLSELDSESAREELQSRVSAQRDMLNHLTIEQLHALLFAYQQNLHPAAVRQRAIRDLIIDKCSQPNPKS